jgi:hypothetical protein
MTTQSELNREEQARINRIFYQNLGDVGAKEIMDDLVRKFEGRTMIKKLADGSVDPYASIAANGAWEVLSYIRQRIELGEKGK